MRFIECLLDLLFPQPTRPARHVTVHPPKPHQGAARTWRAPAGSGSTKPRQPVHVRRRTVVEPDQRPLWQVRGWRKKGKKLVGAFRTPRGSVAGIITLDRRGRPYEYYVVNPGRILHGPKAACFHARKGGRYWVHFSRPPRDLDAGIVAVEELVRLALS